MKKILLTLLMIQSLLLASPPEHKKATANTMLESLNQNHYLDIMIKNLIATQVAQNPLLRIHQKKVTDFFYKYSNFNTLKPKLAELYAKELTIKEMEVFTKFARTKEGQSLLKKMPRLMQQSNNLGAKILQKHYPELLQSLMK